MATPNPCKERKTQLRKPVFVIYIGAACSDSKDVVGRKRFA